MAINFQERARFNETCRENSDRDSLPRIERDERKLQADRGMDFHGNKRQHAASHTPKMRETAELLELWESVAAGIIKAKGDLLALADGKFSASVLHRDCLRNAAAALELHAKVAMSIRQGLSDEYAKQFDQNERAKRCQNVQ